jgi:heme/copper-type cytochrome/quinol oxidase subunit 3
MNIVVAYGFWTFLLSDILMFSALFASYAVLSGQTAGSTGGACRRSTSAPQSPSRQRVRRA